MCNGAGQNRLQKAPKITSNVSQLHTAEKMTPKDGSDELSKI